MLSRRRFLKAAAVATAAPLIWSRTAQAAPSEKIAVGVIGPGVQGRGHVANLLGKGNVEIVAVCDVVHERLDNASQMVEKRYAEAKKAGTYPGVAAYHDFRDLLAHKGLDAVLIATPDHWHAQACVLAARAGKHIYCEKPLTHTVAEGRMIADEVAKAKVTFQTGSQQRTEFGGHFRKAVEYVWNGRIGKLKTIRIGVGNPPVPCDLKTEEAPEGTNWDFWNGPAPERGYSEVLCPKGIHKHFPAWRNYVEYAGGGLADMGAHHFDIAQWALEMDKGGPVKVIPPSDPKKLSGLKLVYANGVEMIHNEFETGPDKQPLSADCVFEGTEGKILVSRGGIRSLPDTILKEPIGEKERHVYPVKGDHQANWLECIKSGKETICPAETGNRSATICHLASIGYRQRRTLIWDPAKERFTDDDAANKELYREPRAKWKLV